MEKVLVIIGPTASGKSDLAVRLARKFGGEIVSADSRQVYRGLDVGAGKITKKEMCGVRHHMLDVANPRKYFSVADYKKLAEEKLRTIESPIIVGGTGLYIDVLSGRMSFPEVPPNKLLRRKLDKLSAEELFRILKKKDPRRAKSIDRKNKVRLVRALEIIEVLGRVPVLPKRPSKNFVFIGLLPSDLKRRIHRRIITRLDGMIREAKKLHRQGITYKKMHELGLEYRYLAAHLQGRLDKKELVKKLDIEIARYARRQMTWFKRNKKIKWFAPSEFRKIAKYARIALKGD